MTGAGVMVAAIAAVVVTGAAAQGEDRDAWFHAGNTAYAEGRFEEARAAYESILDAGYESAAVHYNVGNAYFKLGDLGHAVLGYERARRLEPGDEDVRANLELANSLLADEITPLPGFLPVRVMRWAVEALPGSLLFLLTAAGYVLVGLFGGAWLLSRAPRLRRAVGWAATTAAVVAVVAGANLGARAWLAERRIEAVILSDEVAVYSAPSEDRGLQLFTIHEGTKVRLDQQSGEWAEIVLLDGQVGWVRSGVFEQI